MDAVTRILFLMILVVVAVLTVTSLPTLADEHMAGQRLMIHMMAGGSLVVAMPLFALLFLRRVLSPYRSDRIQRVGFWVLLVAATVSILCVLLSMMPLLSTEAMQTSMSVHGYAGFVAAAALVLLVVGSLRWRNMQSMRSTTPG